MPTFFSDNHRKILFFCLVIMALIQAATIVVAAGAISALFADLAAQLPLANSEIRLLLLTSVIVGLLELLKRRTSEALGLDYAKQVRLLLLELTIRRPSMPDKVRSHGSTLLPFVGDLTALRQWSADGIARGTAAFIVSSCLIAYIIHRNTLLGMTILLVQVVALLAVCVLALPMLRATREQRRHRGSLTALISDRISSSSTVLALGGVRRELLKTRKKIDMMNHASMKRANITGLFRAISVLATSLCVLITLVISSTLIKSNQISSHEIVGLLSLIGLIGSSFIDITRAVELAVPGFISSKRINQRLEEIAPLGMTGTRKSVQTNGGLMLKDLKVPNIKEHFTATVGKGEIILIDDPHCIGKTALYSLISGMTEPASGEISLRTRQTFTMVSKRRRVDIGFASADLPLLKGSLRMNLGYRLRQNTDKKLLELLNKFDLQNFITEQGGIVGLNVMERGNNLSARDSQAIKVVRAIAGNPYLLLLNDVNDQLSESQIVTLNHFIQNWPGIVLFSTQSELLRATANRCWMIGESRIVDKKQTVVPGENISDGPAIYPVSKGGKNVR